MLSRLLGRMRRHGVDASSMLVDVGCGGAGVSLWLAERTGARLYGVDIDPRAVQRARRAARAYSVGHPPTFECASFEATWLEPAIAHAVMSLDALHGAANPQIALAEIHRMLLGGGMLAFNVYVADDDASATTWVQHLEAAGFTVLDIDDQTQAWRAMMTAKHRARVEHASYLLKRFGAAAAPTLAVSRTMLGLDYGTSVIGSTRRVELVARKVVGTSFHRRILRRLAGTGAR